MLLTHEYGYDYYPIPEDPGRGRQMHKLAGYTDRFRRTAPSRELWVVQQAFSWGSISKASGKGDLIHDYNTNTWVPTNARELGARPGVEEIRFMTWIAISHGATGLLWFGSAYEDENRSPLLQDLLAVVEELSQVQPFLTTGNVTRVRTITDERHCPPVLGVSAVARRGPEGTLLALINEDYSDHDVAVTGMRASVLSWGRWPIVWPIP